MSRRETTWYILVILFFIGTFFFFSLKEMRFKYTDSGSMKPTVQPGDRMVTIRSREYRRGDIVILHPPDEPETLMVKRVIGLPGDTVGISDGTLHINHQPVREPYLREATIAYRILNLTVPEDHFFLLGDNRNESEDSTTWGFLPAEQLVGRVIYIYWPPERTGRLRLPEPWVSFTPQKENPPENINSDPKNHPPATEKALEETERLEQVLEFERSQLRALQKGEPADSEAVLQAILEKYQDFIREYPRNPEGYNYLGGLYYDRGLAEKAYQQWKTGLEVDPANPYLYNNIAEYYGHDAGRQLDAIKMVREAIRLKPEVAVFHYNLATYYDVFRYAVLPEFESLDSVFQAMVRAQKRARDLVPEDYGYARMYAQTITYSPRMWKITDPIPVPEKLDAWRYCLDLEPTNKDREFILRQIKRLETAR